MHGSDQAQTPYLLDDDKEAGRSSPVPGRASTPLCFRVLTCVRAVRARATVTGDGHEPRSVTGGEEVFFLGLNFVAARAQFEF